MGTEIALEVGEITVDWSKNCRGADHGALFQEDDRKRLRSEQADYECLESDDLNLAVMELGFKKRLGDVCARLELMGFNLGSIEQEYHRVAEQCREERHELADEDLVHSIELMRFDEFMEFVQKYTIGSLDNSFVSALGEDGERLVMGRFFDDSAKTRIPKYEPHDVWAFSERSYFGKLIGILHPYSILRLLAENRNNEDEKVIWQYGPLVDAGWATTEEFTPGVRRTQTFLIATEGSSDTLILKHAFFAVTATDFRLLSLYRYE